MKRLFSAAAALCCAVGLAVPASGQTNIYTPVTAISITVAGVPVSTGVITVTPVDASGNAIAIRTPDNQLYLPGPALTATITNGAIASGLQVPDQCTARAVTSIAPIGMKVAIVATVSGKTLTSGFTSPAGAPLFCGATSVAINAFAQAQTTTVPGAGILAVATLPNHCSSASVLYLTVPPYSVGTCVNGTPVVLADGSGGGVPLTVTTTGSGAAAYNSGTGVLNIPTPSSGGSTGTTLTTLTCNGALAIPMPAAGTKVFYQVNTTANCSVSFTGLAAANTAVETRVRFNPTAFAVTFATSSTVKWNGGSAPDAPTSTNPSAFHLTAYPDYILGRD